MLEKYGFIKDIQTWYSYMKAIEELRRKTIVLYVIKGNWGTADEKK